MTDPRVQVSDGSSRTSSTLLQRIRAREQSAWERLVHVYAPLVYHWCRQCGLQQEDAKEIGQEVFIAVHRGIASFRHDREGDTFRGWLRKITVNRIRDFLTRKPPGANGAGGSAAAEMLRELPGLQPDHSGASEVSENLILLRRAADLVLANCHEKTRKAFLRVVIGEEDPEDVARDLGMTVNSIYLAKSRLLSRLRDEFDEVIDLPEK